MWLLTVPAMKKRISLTTAVLSATLACQSCVKEIKIFHRITPIPASITFRPIAVIQTPSANGVRQIVVILIPSGKSVRRKTVILIPTSK